MLEQRRAKQQGYLTLKEAAEIAGYSSDYIGQLIRAGKIRGTQVYCGTAWMTTETEVKAYMQNKDRSVITTDSFDARLQQFLYRLPFSKKMVTGMVFAFAILAVQVVILHTYIKHTVLVQENYQKEMIANGPNMLTL